MAGRARPVRHSNKLGKNTTNRAPQLITNNAGDAVHAGDTEAGHDDAEGEEPR